MRFGARIVCCSLLIAAGCADTGQNGHELDAGNNNDASLPPGDAMVPDAGPTTPNDGGAVTETDSEVSEDGGKVEVTVDIVSPARLRCPVVLGMDVLPAQTRVGKTISLTAWVSNGTRLVSWSSEGGSFFPTTTSKTTFTCSVAGTHELRAVPGADPGCPAAGSSVLVECSP